MSLIKKIKELLLNSKPVPTSVNHQDGLTVAKTTVGLYYPESKMCMIRNPNGSGDAHVFNLELPISKVTRPVSGIWTKSGKTGIAFYDVERSVFFFKRILNDGGIDGYIPFGSSENSLMPIAGDWDGDGVSGIGVFNSKSRTFHLKNQLKDGTADYIFSFGKANQGLIPIAGDWDGDGSESIGLYDPINGEFLLKNALSGGISDIKFTVPNHPAYGLPLAGDWLGTGRASVGIYDMATGSFRLIDNLGQPEKFHEFAFGPSGQISIPFSIKWFNEY